MNWDDVDVFCRVVEHGGFSAAARLDGRARSSLSACVQRLEQQLGLQLLQRTTRRVSLTEAGTQLYHDAAPALRQLREVRHQTQLRRQGVSGTLRIAAPYEFGAHHIGVVALGLLRQHPALSIDLRVEHGPADPQSRPHDIAFVMASDDLPDSAAVARRMFTLERGLFAAPALLQALGPVASADDLRRLPQITAQGETRWTLSDERGQLHHLDLQARLSSANAGVRRDAALQGLGVTCITASFCAEAVQAGRLLRVLPSWRCAPLRVYALLPGRTLQPPRVQVFLDALAAHASVLDQRSISAADAPS